MNSKVIYIGFILSVLFAVSCYLGTDSLITSLPLFVITLVYFIFIVSKRFTKFDKRISRFHECYFFMSNFIVSLSVKNSLNAALTNVKDIMSDDYLEEMGTIEEMNEGEKLQYLKKYFPFHVYQIFVDVITLWLDQGGDILKMTSSLMEQTRQIEEYIIFSESVNKSRLIEFIVLWLLSIVIIVILRFSLDSFFGSITKQIVYQVGIMSFFLLILVSTEFMTRRMTNVVIKGAENETK